MVFKKHISLLGSINSQEKLIEGHVHSHSQEILIFLQPACHTRCSPFISSMSCWHLRFSNFMVKNKFRHLGIYKTNKLCLEGCERSSKPTVKPLLPLYKKPFAHATTQLSRFNSKSPDSYVRQFIKLPHENSGSIYTKQTYNERLFTLFWP